MTTTTDHDGRALAHIAEKLAKAALDIALISSKLGPAVDHCSVVVSCSPLKKVSLTISAPDQSHAQSILDKAWDHNLFISNCTRTGGVIAFDSIEVSITTREDKISAVHKAGLALCRDLLTSTEQQETA